MPQLRIVIHRTTCLGGQTVTQNLRIARFHFPAPQSCFPPSNDQTLIK
jgi:hypothetical protein